MTDQSVFLAVPPTAHVAGNRLAFAIWDRFPVTEGHALVITRRVVPDWWQATAEERDDLLALVAVVKSEIERLHQPDGFNVGFNAGDAAGQTVPHLHVHVIPRYYGDVPDPRGGVRNVIPSKGNYLASSPARVSDVAMFGGPDAALLTTVVDRLRDTRFDRVDLVVSFVMRSGLRLLDEPLQDALGRGARVRVLTTDYLGITEKAALARLLDLSQDSQGALEVRIFHDASTSFHPKGYLFWSSSGDVAAAVVGSSNLSRSGLVDGVEWNVGLDGAVPMLERFTDLWDDRRSVELTAEFLRGYRPRLLDTTLAPAVEIAEAPVQPVAPRPIQREALSALEQTRLAGHRAGLVVMATGLGKTWLAAFDTARPEFGRALFVAHREEILRQSRDVFRQVQPESDLGLYFGGEKTPDARFVFASVQTLSKRLEAFEADAFDYIVVDEFHHASAPSYRKVIDHFTPKFLLGLTATPERMDGADLLALCGDNAVFDCGLFEGIERKELVPFRYRGVPDSVDFEPIPWRNGRFDPAALERAVETQERAQRSLEEWQDHRGDRTIAFCVSTRHADFMAEFFRANGIRAAAVHSNPTSAPRHESLEQLRDGDLDVVFAVDLFNEGLDAPQVDTVLMLRPTQSPIVFLQQLGRGLRTAEGKSLLKVVDFIGNHRSFLLKPRTLLSLGTRTLPSTRAVVEALERGDFALPEGCSVDYDLEAVDLLRTLAASSSRSAIDEYCRSHAEEDGTRPSATQTFHAGYNPASVRAKHGGWFGYLDHLGLASERETQVVAAVGEVLDGLEREPINKSYKLVLLRALLHDGALRSGTTIAQLAATSRTIILGDPRLLRDVTGNEIPDLATATSDAWESYWRRWPVAAWAGELSGTPGRWFQVVDDRFQPTFRVPDDLGDSFDAMAAEIVEYRLSRYLTGQESQSEDAWTLKVSHADGRPILFLNRERNVGLPEGKVSFVANGREYVGHFVKVAMNVAELPGQAGNALHALLRGWFGPSAGHPGTHHQVVFQRTGEGLSMRPVEVVETQGADVIPLFASYQVACGAFSAKQWNEHAVTSLPIHLQAGDAAIDPARHFVCFARGDSMDGGPDPIRHGDPLVFEWVESGSARDYVDQRVLVEHADRDGTAAALKVLRRDGPAYRLDSENPTHPSIAGDRQMTVAARLVRRLDQGAINPLATRIGARFKRQDVPTLYGLDYNPGNWQAGHVSIPPHVVLFVTLTKSEAMTWGADYVDHFEGLDTFVWSSQTSTGPDGKKGREILEALSTGTLIHLWARRRKTDVAFVYLGLIVPVTHEGAKPMSVRFRLLAPLTSDLHRQLTAP
jgi:superfamily II DNA or RNA helicase/diadenosine tetraphosphate (Ap4A) HIT family hydrolase/HKD family nuclease/SOS-response transcriptional repressor LexA